MLIDSNELKDEGTSMRVWSALLISLFMAAAGEAQFRGMRQGFQPRNPISSIPPGVNPAPHVIKPNVGIKPGFRQGFVPGF